MNYWHMQLHPDNKTDFPREKIKQILLDKKIIGLGEWDNGQSQINQFNNDMAIGDIILIRADGPMALVEIIGAAEYTDDTNKDLDWFCHRRQVRVLAFYDEYSGLLPYKLGSGYWALTLSSCKSFTGSMEDGYTVGDYIKSWYKLLKQVSVNNMISDIATLLKQKKQIILQGAPGTGKTYISAEIALRLIEPGITYKDRKSLMKAYQDKVKAGQIAFTTFHQSMDYEEFVEGLKPVAENEKISYAVQPGIFKRICTDAMEQGGLFDIESAIEKFKDAATDNLVELTTKTGLKFSVSYRGGRTFSVKTENSKTDENSVLPANIESIKDLYRDENCKTMYSRSYVWGILNHLKTEYKLPVYDVNNDKKNGNKNYVLIIDEINRGNITKILGELITLLESDKRLGEENQLTVKLPYTHTENPDAPEFGVPSNLYIIGTMNSADRSVGHIDYAIRRRFAFVTLKSEKSAIEGYFNNLNKPDAPKDIALKLFDDVVNVFNDISPEFDKDDLMIGHSYFMADSIDSLRMKLDYEIRPLLIEYLKDGILKESAKESIGKLSI